MTGQGSSAANSTEGGGELRRSVGLLGLTLYGLGTILGAGIYVLVGKVAGVSGVYAPAAFLTAAVVAGLTAFSYAELAARYPKSAGEAVYMLSAFRAPAPAIVVGLLVAAAGVASSATLGRGFVGYAQSFVDWPGWLLSSGLVVGLGAVAAWGIGASVAVAGTLTLVEVAGLLMVIGVSGDSLAGMAEQGVTAVVPLDIEAWKVVMAGTSLAFFAFVGFEDMVNVAEEVRRPERTLPLAIIIALAVATLLYLLVVLAAVAAVPVDDLATSAVPLALVYETNTGKSAVVLTTIGMTAAVNGVLVQIIMVARIAYGMAARGWLPAALARVHPRTSTPVLATLAVTVIVAVLAVGVPLIGLADAASLLVLSVFVLMNAALIVIKRRDPVPPEVTPVPGWIPWAGLLCSLVTIAAWFTRGV